MAPGRRARHRAVLLLGGLPVALLAVLALGTPTPLPHGPLAIGAPTAAAAPLDHPAAAGRSPATPIVSLGISSSPSAICEAVAPNCPAGNTESTVQLTAQAGVKGHNAWPAVQLLFLVETTPYDGVYDPSAEVPGSDPCADATFGVGPLCDESNGVPFFLANAGTVAERIQLANPNTSMTFGLADFFATKDLWDSGGGTVYHIDLGQFVNATAFQRSVVETFQQEQFGGGYILPHSDLLENFLTSDSITALYGALNGWGGVRWSNATHHVVVMIGSTAPRAPQYPEDYCVSPAVTPHGLTNCTASTCEPVTLIGQNSTPACEGWVTGPVNFPMDSIAALTRSAPSCVGSLGGNCTIDVIDLNDTPTDPTSAAWSAAGGSGSPANWTLDASNILQAGCDLATATSGSWNGPGWFDCRSLSTTGTLTYVAPRTPAQPVTSNPTLLAALTDVGLGAVPNPVVASGAGQPMFEFFPYGFFSLAPNPAFSVVCTNASGGSLDCPTFPTYLTSSNGVTGIGWNFSSIAAENVMHLGDRWSARFSVVDNSPPFGVLPIDACVTPSCLATGAGSDGGAYTAMTYLEYGGSNLITQSYEVTEVELLPPNYLPPAVGQPLPVIGGTVSPSPPASSPPALPPTPAAPIPAAVIISVQATSAGFIAAGFIQLGVRMPPQSQKQASLSGAMGKGKKRKRKPGEGPARLPVNWQ